MTGWVLSPTLDVWIADLGTVTALPDSPTVGVMPPSTVCGEIDYIVTGGTFDDLITQDWAWVLANAHDSNRTYPVGSTTPDNTDTFGVTPSAPWTLAVAFSGPASSGYHAPAVPPSVAPESLAPPGWTPPSPPVSPAEPRPAYSLFDTDGTFLADLPLAAGRQFQEELSAPGAVSFRLPLDDSATAMVTPDRIVKVFWRGAYRQAARIGGSSTNVAADGRVWREWSNVPGLMSILGGVTVYPEYGLDRAGQATRTFGYMSRTGHGEWLGSGNWTDAVGVSWATMTGHRAGLPEGLDLPNPDWIAKRGPLHDEPPLSYQYFRRRWTTTAAANVQILATGDNNVDLWLDGEKLIDSAGQGRFTFRDAFQITAHLPAGLHVLAARVRNAKDTTYPTNPTGLLFTMKRVQQNGDVIDEPPLINSDYRWLVSDVTPGFRWAEVVHQLWAEGLNYGYGACTLLPLGFTRTTGSDDVAFDEAPGEHTLDVGSSALDVLAMATETDVDVNVDPDTLQLRMWNRRGADKTATVQLRLGRDAGNLAGHTVEVTGPKYNTLLMQLADGTWRQRQDATAVAARGREGGGIAMGSTTSTRTANQTADAQLLEASRKGASFTTEVSTLIGPQVYVEYGPGDTVTVPDEAAAGGGYAARVMAVTVDVPDDGSPVKVTPELMLDRSATPLAASDGGAGTGDPGDIGAATDVPPHGDGGGTGGGGSSSAATFADTFTTLDATRWNVRTDTQSNHYGYNLPANVTIQSDGLHITAKREAFGGKPYTTGYIDTIGKFSASVGRWEIDAKLPTFLGAWPALWLRCDTTAGEIDILEAIGGLPTKVVQTVHESTNGTGDKSGYEWNEPGFNPAALHTYALERDADGSLRWYIDGALTRSRTPADLDNQHNVMTWLNGATFASPLNIRINLQVGGSMPAYYGKDVTSSSVLPDDMVIRAVRFYA